MNLVAGRILRRLGMRSNITRFVDREQTKLLSCTTFNIQTRCKTRFSHPSLFPPEDTSRDSHNEQSEKIGFSGFLLLGIPVSTFLLGTWQVQRRKWKLKLIDDLEKKTSLEPVDLLEVLDELDEKEYHPVKLRGTFLHDKEITIGPRSLVINSGLDKELNRRITKHERDRGYCVITPFKLADRDLTILVNRGWVPRERRTRAARPTDQVQGVVEITGVVRLNETRPTFFPHNMPDDGVWHYRDLNAMAEKLGTAPVYVDMVYKKDFPGLPVSGQTRITLRNEHLVYIITWYSLSLITAYMWHRLFILKLPLQ